MTKQTKRRRREAKTAPASNTSPSGTATPIATAPLQAEPQTASAPPEQAGERIITAHSLGLPPTTDSGNAEFIASLYGDVLRYDHKQHRWLIWDKNRRQWCKDESHAVRLFAIKAARHRRRLAAQITEEKEAKNQFRWAYQSEDRNRLDAALDIVKSLPPVSDAGDKWDADPWLLGVGNGVIDLRTGTLREEKQEDRITKHSPIRHDPEAECPRFESFLCEIFDYDPELFSYLWKAVGYSLTGLTREQCIFCCYGLGANGKSKLFGALHHVLGDYAANLPFSALEMKNRNSHDLVALAGARLATASETNEGVRLNESRIKALTGGDLITARPLFHMPFTFPPTHKLWLAFNHKPIIADDSKGMWRRIRLIPFLVQFEGERDDKHLEEKLLAEAPGILAWAVKGCLLWQQEGLEVPLAVAEATAAYRDESDHLSQFIEDCCVVGPDAESLSSVLWHSYQDWVKRNEEVPLTRLAFSDRLKKRGFKADRSGHGGQRGWVGIGVNGDVVTHGDTNSDNSSTRENIKGKNTESASPSVTVSPSPQKPTPNGVSGHPAGESEKGADTEKRVLEVEI